MAVGLTRESYPERSLRDFFSILFRHKWKGIIFFSVVLLTVTIGTLLASAVYRSEAKLLVRIGRESVTLDPTAATGQVISIGQSRESEINSELEILKSRELAEKVVKTLGSEVFLKKNGGRARGVKSESGWGNSFRDVLETLRPFVRAVENFFEDLAITPGLAPQEKAVLLFTKNLNIEGQKNSNILSISFEARDPQVAREAVARLIDFYLDKHIAAHRTPGSYDFFVRQADEFRKKLIQTGEELRSLKNKKGIASIEEQRRALIERANGLQKEFEAVEAMISSSLSKVDVLEKQVANLQPTIVSQTQETVGNMTHGLDLMRARLYELKLKKEELLSRYTESSFPVLEIQRQIGEAEAILARQEPTRTQQVSKGINPSYQSLELALLTERANLSSLRSKANVLKRQLEGIRGEINELNNMEFQINHLQRELNLQEAKYRKHVENLEQARIDQALEINKISNISVVQAATLPLEPVRPRKALNLALGLILAILGGIGIAFFSEYLDHSIKSPQDVEERLQLPLLASIPRLKK